MVGPPSKRLSCGVNNAPLGTAVMLEKPTTLGRNAPKSVSPVLERSARFSGWRPADRAPKVQIPQVEALRVSRLGALSKPDSVRSPRHWPAAVEFVSLSR